MISVETYVLSKNYTDKQIMDIEAVAIEGAVTKAVEQAKQYTDQQVAIGAWNISIVTHLPPISEVDTHTIYFVPMSKNTENNNYYEYIYVNDWELIGSTEFKPENYMTKQEIENYVANHMYVLEPATENSMGGVKVDTSSIALTDDGEISVSTITTNDILNLF